MEDRDYIKEVFDEMAAKWPENYFFADNDTVFVERMPNHRGDLKDLMFGFYEDLDGMWVLNVGCALSKLIVELSPQRQAEIVREAFAALVASEGEDEGGE